MSIRKNQHRVALALASLAIGLVATELALREVHETGREALAERANLPRLCAKSDPDLVYTYVPGACGHNDRGYRDVHHPAVKPAGVRRIVVIGDSVAEGRGVPLFKSFPSLLGRGLSRSGTPYEVIILARSGYGTRQQISLLEREAYTYDPDVILWSYVLNDPADPVHHNASGERGAYYYRPGSYLLHAVRAGFFGLRERWRDTGCPDEYHARLHCLYAPEIRESFDQIGQVAREREVPLVLVIHPVFEEGREFDSYTLREVHDDLAKHAAANDIPVIDLLPAYEQHPADELRQRKRKDWFDPWHPSKRGHQVAAATIQQQLQALNLVPPPARRPAQHGNED